MCHDVPHVGAIRQAEHGVAEFVGDDGALHGYGLRKVGLGNVNAGATAAVRRVAAYLGCERDHNYLHAIGAHGLPSVVWRPEGKSKSDGGYGDHVAKLPQEKQRNK